MALKLTQSPPHTFRHTCTSAALGQVLTNCGTPVVEGGQPAIQKQNAQLQSLIKEVKV